MSYCLHHIREKRICGLQQLASVHDGLSENHTRMPDSEIFGNPEKDETILKRS